MIDVQDFHKIYDETVAVCGLSFEVPPGAIMGLVGPNGAGKTTTLRALAGIISPTQGQLAIAGKDIVDDEVAAKSRLAYIPDDPRLFDGLTVWEHLEFIAASYQVADFAEEAGQWLERFELTEKRDTMAQELSRGMRQKVAICCGYIHHPSVILLDEPLTGLDPLAIRTMKASVREQADRGASIMISSHLLSLVEDLCTHLLILRRGQSLFCGTLDEALQKYAGLDESRSLEEVFFTATAQQEVVAAEAAEVEVEGD